MDHSMKTHCGSRGTAPLKSTFNTESTGNNLFYKSFYFFHISKILYVIPLRLAMAYTYTYVTSVCWFVSLWKDNTQSADI